MEPIIKEAISFRRKITSSFPRVVVAHIKRMNGLFLAQTLICVAFEKEKRLSSVFQKYNPKNPSRQRLFRNPSTTSLQLYSSCPSRVKSVFLFRLVFSESSSSNAPIRTYPKARSGEIANKIYIRIIGEKEKINERYRSNSKTRKHTKTKRPTHLGAIDSIFNRCPGFFFRHFQIIRVMSSFTTQTICSKVAEGDER
jgi:hypothetical protein